MIQAVKFVVNEHTSNMTRIWHIALSHLKKQTIRTSLGIGWTIIKDIIYLTSFTLFRYLLSGGHNVGGVHFIAYLISGLIPWFFMNDVLHQGANAIRMNRAIVTTLKFPITTLPSIEVIAIFLNRLFSLVIMFVIIYIFEGLGGFSPLLFIYYFVSMFIFSIALTLVTSAFISISHDFHQLYLSVVRVLFFLVPVIWSFDYIKDMHTLLYVLKLVPFTYIITGFRDAMFTGAAPSLLYTVYFWGLTVFLFLTGSFVQFKLRKYYADFI